jgi:hypothetical protein
MEQSEQGWSEGAGRPSRQIFADRHFHPKIALEIARFWLIAR